MESKKRALKYFREGYNCAQSVLMACSGEERTMAAVATAFGGGIARLQGTCGAVTGAYIYLGLKETDSRDSAEEKKTRVYSRVRAFRDAFIERNGTDQCSGLLGEDLNTPGGRERIRERGLSVSVCEKCILDSIEIIGKME